MACNWRSCMISCGQCPTIYVRSMKSKCNSMYNVFMKPVPCCNFQCKPTSRCNNAPIQIFAIFVGVYFKLYDVNYIALISINSAIFVYTWMCMHLYYIIWYCKTVHIAMYVNLLFKCTSYFGQRYLYDNVKHLLSNLFFNTCSIERILNSGNISIPTL